MEQVPTCRHLEQILLVFKGADAYCAFGILKFSVILNFFFYVILNGILVCSLLELNTLEHPDTLLVYSLLLFAFIFILLHVLRKILIE